MIIDLDGQIILSRKGLYQELKRQIKSEELIGTNLDALFDVLISYKGPIEINIIHIKDLEYHLKDYYKLLIDLFDDVQKSNINCILSYH